MRYVLGVGEAGRAPLAGPMAVGGVAVAEGFDFLQVRNGAVHILDYKPSARADKPIAQLMVYALALTRLAGLRLFDIKCAWFDQDEYCEFFPRALLPRHRSVDKAATLTKRHATEPLLPRTASA